MPCAHVPAAGAAVGQAFFGPGEWAAAEWACFGQFLTHLELLDCVPIVSKQVYSQLSQLPSLVLLRLSYSRSESGDADEGEPLAVRLGHLECLELTGFSLFGPSIERCPRLHTLTLKNAWLEGRCRAAHSCPR